MSCPTIRISLSKGYTNAPGGNNATYTYYSTCTVEVVNGNSTAPLYGEVVLHWASSNATQTLVLNNPTNSFTSADFILNGDDFYLNDLAEFTIFANSGTCIFQASVNLLDTDVFPCITSINETGNGEPLVYQDCLMDMLIEGEIIGCTDPLALNYNPDATISDDSCVYDSITPGCTDRDAINFNPDATFDDGSCIYPALGCTDPNASNYNAGATVDDGSCIYIPFSQILGCNNPMAINFNENATFNDGSCIFLSGCTNPSSDNYNPLAAVDDGSCECNKLELLFQLDGENSFYFYSSGETKCDYFLEFDYRIQVDCEKFIEFFDQKSNETPLSILDKIKLYSEVRFGESIYRQLELDVDAKTPKLDFELIGNDCETLLALIAEELGENCPKDITNLFNNQWFSARLKIPESFLNQNVNVGTFLEGISFGSKLLIDNVKLFSVCYLQNEECIIVPYTFGFNFELLEDNKKSYYKNFDSDLLNTKEVTLKIDIPNYIKNDVISFLNKYEIIINQIYSQFTEDKLKKQFTNVDSVLTSGCYNYHLHLYDLYLNSFKYCSAKSKALDYEFMFKVLSEIGDEWLDLIAQFVPETTIWKKNSKFYSNLIFHQQKFKYKKYVLTSAENDYNVEQTCIIKTLDECEQTIELVNKIDEQLLVSAGLCETSTEINPTNFSSTFYGAGRLLQVNKDTNEIYKSVNYPQQTYLTCQ